jgi:hypothetical protein
MTLAFRLYGNFHWPPSAGKAPPADPKLKTATASGIIEVHLIAPAGQAEHRTQLRWIPRDQVDAIAEEPTDPIADIFDLTAEKLTEWFDGHASTRGRLWLGSSGATAGVDRTLAIFRGAFLFEQYDVEGADTGALDVQWPLVTQCAYKARKPVYSVLGICRHQAKPRLYFNFHLPLPVRRTSHADSKPENSAFFPFSAVFDLTPASKAQLIRIDTLVAGWKADDQLPKLDIEEATSFPFKGDKNPETKELGKFGFAEYGRTAGTHFAVYKLPSGKTGEYWPRNRQSLLQDILWRYGFELDYGKTQWLKAANIGLADSSLRFAPPGNGTGSGRGRRSALIYRTSVVLAAAPPKGNDLQGDASGLRLRLRQEIGGRRADGTQFGAGESDAKERAAVVEGWLRVGQVLSADCELSWEIAPQDIWTADPSTDWGLTVTVRLHWKETVAPNHVEPTAAPKQPADGSSSNDFKAGLLAQANFTLREVRDALGPGEAGRPHSFLPELSAAAGKPVRFAVYGSPMPAQFNGGVITWGRAAPTDPTGLPPWRRPPMRLSLASKSDLIAELVRPNEHALALSAEKLTFFQDGGALALRLRHDINWPPKSVDTIEDGPPFFASFALDAFPTGTWSGRLGSLQFGGIKQEVIEGDAEAVGHLRIGGRGTRLGLGEGAPVLTYPDGRIATEIRLGIPAARVEPIGVDVARADRSGRPGPLLIPLDASGGASKSPANLFWLITTETLSPTHDRLLEATVSENSQETGTRSYVVLASEPFSIFRFTHQPLHGRGQADTAAVAFYSGDDRIWQYRRVSDFYHYVLPPQSIGESADKPRRLEIHDLPEPSAETPPRPYPGDKDAKPLKPHWRRAVEFRLTPSAEIWIRPSDVERGYFMPESTSYEIFRQPGQYGLGAALGYLRAEFLYGLAVGIDVAKERSISRGARVAEIEALTGRLTGPAREQDAEGRLSERWNALRSAVARRPERLEIWARDLESAIDFTPARFSDGVQYALRHTALHRAPVIDQAPDPDKDEGLSEGLNDFRSPPRIAGLLPSQVPTALEANPRHHPQGLSGGALWPVESLNLFRSMLQAPQSSGGAIESIALAPIGGDATQKAEFLGGKVTIISDTRNGYVERQQVEVLGRICALWHRAKHVVVYERTVNPSAQFAPKKNEDPQRTRSRRPILRKVREYIELLQPERSYPDFSTAAQRSAGFLERVRFNSKIINVDSAWARDIGTFGWEIPLWNRLSARQRPQVYPMPDIAFVSAAEGDGDKPVVAQECLDPDHLFFFADVSVNTTSDTDSWPSLLGLDFPNMPVARAIAEKADIRSSEDPGVDEKNNEKRRRAVGRILPGLRRFTWRLAPAAQKATINAGRAGKPVYAGLESVCFMRATHAEKDHQKLPDDLGSIITAAAAFPAASPAEQQLAGLGYWKAGDKAAPIPEVTEFIARQDAIVSAINTKNVEALKKGVADLDAFLTSTAGGKTKFSAKIAQGVAKQLKLNDLTDLKLGHLKVSASTLKQGPRYCATLKADAVELIQRKEMLVRAALQDWVAQADDILDKVKPYVDGATKEKAINELKQLAVAHIRPIFAEASADIGKIGEGVEKSRAVLLELEAEIEAVIERARQRIIQFVNGYDQTKPWSPERRTAFRSGLEVCISNIEEDIAAAIEETRQRLGVELNEVSQAIGGHIAKLLKELTQLEAKSLKRVSTVHRFVDQLFEKVDKVLEPLLQSGPGDKLDDLIARVQASTTISSGLKTTADAALQAVKSACTSAQGKVAQARATASALDARAEEVAADVTAAADAARAAVKEAKEAGEALAQHAQTLAGLITQLVNEGGADIAEAIGRITGALKGEIDAILATPDQWLAQIGSQIDAMVKPATAFLLSKLAGLKDRLRKIPADVMHVIDDVGQTLQTVQDALAPGKLLENVVKEKIVGAALIKLLEPLPEKIEKTEQIEAAVKRIRQQLGLLVETVGDLMRNFKETTLDALDQVTSVCNALFEGAAEVEKYLSDLASDAAAYLDKSIDQALAALKSKLGTVGAFANDVSDLLGAVQAFDYSVRSLQNNLARAHETARAYGDRVFDQFSKLGDGGVLAAPSNILKLYSAVTQAPELAALKADIDRIRASFDEFGDIIETTKANALFNRLGDELKALGLSLPFDKIGDRLLPANLQDFDIGRVFRSFGGTKLDNLLKGYRVPAGVKDAVRVSHDFDKKEARAWVQVDIDAPMPGRRSLFSVGIFKADFVDMKLTGQVRLEASKDTDKVTETGYGRIGTAIDLVVGGQSMVRFEKIGLSFTREKGLDVEFDPKNIRLNPSFKYIQDFLSSLFPDEIGGLEVIKQNGIPVGVQHTFSIPPISLNFATSGVSNISISNQFKLLAFPDFMLANRFNLSTVERPFIFSIFIIGGTGYIQIDAEYRPFDSELMVSVEAGAGGSASLAFAFGPFVGQVFITLSGALTYRKVIGKSGGGLSISAILVIAGHVDVAGLITIGIVLMLRMTYRDNGQIDADGSLAVTIRISRFFKITARANVKYKLRGGKSETVVTSGVDAEITDKETLKKVDQLKKAAAKLEKARN